MTSPAGTFDAFRLEYIGYNQTPKGLVENRITMWRAAAVRLPVVREEKRSFRGQIIYAERGELVSYRQQA